MAILGTISQIITCAIVIGLPIALLILGILMTIKGSANEGNRKLKIIGICLITLGVLIGAAEIGAVVVLSQTLGQKMM